MSKFRVEFKTERPSWASDISLNCDTDSTCPGFQVFEFECCGINHANAIVEKLMETLEPLLRECDFQATLSHTVVEVFEGKKENA